MEKSRSEAKNPQMGLEVESLDESRLAMPANCLPVAGQVSHEKNPALLSIESWLVNRDPYNGLL